MGRILEFLISGVLRFLKKQLEYVKLEFHRTALSVHGLSIRKLPIFQTWVQIENIYIDKLRISCPWKFWCAENQPLSIEIESLVGLILPGDETAWKPLINNFFSPTGEGIGEPFRETTFGQRRTTAQHSSLWPGSEESKKLINGIFAALSLARIKIRIRNVHLCYQEKFLQAPFQLGFALRELHVQNASLCKNASAINNYLLNISASNVSVYHDQGFTNEAKNTSDYHHCFLKEIGGLTDNPPKHSYLLSPLSFEVRASMSKGRDRRESGVAVKLECTTSDTVDLSLSQSQIDAVAFVAWRLRVIDAATRMAEGKLTGSDAQQRRREHPPDDMQSQSSLVRSVFASFVAAGVKIRLKRAAQVESIVEWHEIATLVKLSSTSNSLMMDTFKFFALSCSACGADCRFTIPASTDSNNDDYCGYVFPNENRVALELDRMPTKIQDSSCGDYHGEISSAITIKIAPIQLTIKSLSQLWIEFASIKQWVAKFNTDVDGLSEGESEDSASDDQGRGGNSFIFPVRSMSVLVMGCQLLILEKQGLHYSGFRLFVSSVNVDTRQGCIVASVVDASIQTHANQDRHYCLHSFSIDAVLSLIPKQRQMRQILFLEILLSPLTFVLNGETLDVSQNMIERLLKCGAETSPMTDAPSVNPWESPSHSKRENSNSCSIELVSELLSEQSCEKSFASKKGFSFAETVAFYSEMCEGFFLGLEGPAEFLVKIEVVEAVKVFMPPSQFKAAGLLLNVTKNLMFCLQCGDLTKIGCRVGEIQLAGIKMDNKEFFSLFKGSALSSWEYHDAEKTNLLDEPQLFWPLNKSRLFDSLMCESPREFKDLEVNEIWWKSLDHRLFNVLKEDVLLEEKIGDFIRFSVMFYENRVYQDRSVNCQIQVGPTMIDGHMRFLVDYLREWKCVIELANSQIILRPVPNRQSKPVDDNPIEVSFNVFFESIAFYGYSWVNDNVVSSSQLDSVPYWKMWLSNAMMELKSCSFILEIEDCSIECFLRDEKQNVAAIMMRQEEFLKKRKPLSFELTTSRNRNSELITADLSGRLGGQICVEAQWDCVLFIGNWTNQFVNELKALSLDLFETQSITMEAKSLPLNDPHSPEQSSCPQLSDDCSRFSGRFVINAILVATTLDSMTWVIWSSREVQLTGRGKWNSSSSVMVQHIASSLSSMDVELLPDCKGVSLMSMFSQGEGKATQHKLITLSSIPEVALDIKLVEDDEVVPNVSVDLRLGSPREREWPALLFSVSPKALEILLAQCIDLYAAASKLNRVESVSSLGPSCCAKSIHLSVVAIYPVVTVNHGTMCLGCSGEVVEANVDLLLEDSRSLTVTEFDFRASEFLARQSFFDRHTLTNHTIEFVSLDVGFFHHLQKVLLLVEFDKPEFCKIIPDTNRIRPNKRGFSAHLQVSAENSISLHSCLSAGM